MDEFSPQAFTRARNLPSLLGNRWPFPGLCSLQRLVRLAESVPEPSCSMRTQLAVYLCSCEGGPSLLPVSALWREYSQTSFIACGALNMGHAEGSLQGCRVGYEEG